MYLYIYIYIYIYMYIFIYTVYMVPQNRCLGGGGETRHVDVFVLPILSISCPGRLRVPLSYTQPFDHKDPSPETRLHRPQQECVRRSNGHGGCQILLPFEQLIAPQIALCSALFRVSDLPVRICLGSVTSLLREVLHACHGGQEKRHPNRPGPVVVSRRHPVIGPLGCLSRRGRRV